MTQSETKLHKHETSVKIILGVVSIFFILWLIWVFTGGDKSFSALLSSTLNAIVFSSLLVIYLGLAAVRDLKNIQVGPWYLRPVVLFLGLYLLYVVWGVLTHFITLAFFYYYETRIEEAVIYSNIGMVSFLMGYLVWKRIRKKRVISLLHEQKREYINWNLRRLRLGIIVLAIVSLCGTFITFLKLGGIPVFLPGGVGNVNPELAEASKSIFRQLHDFNAIVIFLAAIYLMKTSKDLVIISFGVLSLLALLSFGARYPFVMPVMTAFFVYNHYVKQIKLREAVVVFIVMASFLILYSWWRNRLVEATAFAGVGDARLGIIESIGNAFTELRDFGRWIEQFSEGAPIYLGLILILGAIMAMFPKQIWILVGIEKDKYLINSAYLTGTLIYNESYTGIRIGLVGELFISFGVIGIVCGMFVFGVVFALLDNKLLTAGSKGAQLPIVYYVVFILTFSLIGHLQAMVAGLTYYAYVIYAIYYFARVRHSVVS